MTQLVFEHSLRIRLKAEASDEKTEDNLTAIGVQDSASVTEGISVNSNSSTGEIPSESSHASTPISRDSSTDSQSTGPVKRKGSSTLKNIDKSAIKDKKEAENLIGKINNLVTTDIGNIVEGRDFLFISTLQFFSLGLGLPVLSDNLASFIHPTRISSVHHLLI